MIDIIERILNIEAAADEVVGEALAARESFDSDITNELTELEAGIKKRSDERCAKLKAFEDEDAKKQIEAIRDDMQKSAERLDNIYAENADKWVARIFDRVIGL